MSKILLIGCGHMGTALVMSWLNLKAYSFTVVDPYNFIKLKKQFKSKKINILKKTPNQKDMKTFDIIIFAVKPQNANDVLNEYENFELKKNVLIGSIIAGKKINFFKKIKTVLINTNALFFGIHFFYFFNKLFHESVKTLCIV